MAALRMDFKGPKNRDILRPFFDEAIPFLRRKTRSCAIIHQFS
jgi:hypothetical protein